VEVVAIGADGTMRRLVSWGVEITAITAIPEPSNVALGLFGASALVVLIARSRLGRSGGQRLKAALARRLGGV
jgi:hypothetical protein